MKGKVPKEPAYLSYSYPSLKHVKQRSNSSSVGLPHDDESLTMMIPSFVVLLLLLPSALAQCCTQGSKGLDVVLLVDTDSASLADQTGGRNPLDFAKNFLTQLLFNYGMDISANDQTGVRVAVYSLNATGAFPTKATLQTADIPNNPNTVRNAIDNLIPDGSSNPDVDIDNGFLQAQNLFNKPTLGERQNIPNVVITISSSTYTTAALYDATILQRRYGALMIGIGVSLAASQLDYSPISSPNAAFTVTSLSPNGFDSLINPILGLFCIAEGFCSSGNSTQFPPTTTSSSSGQANQHRECFHGDQAWPMLWLDVAILIENSAAQTDLNFKAMIEQTKEIWAPGSGGPVVGQGTARTRVAVVTFDTQAYVVANLTQFNTNSDLINVLSGINQTTATTVDGSNALQTVGALFGPDKFGDRQNAPNVIIIYTADWAGNDPCQIASNIQEHSVVLVVTVKNRNGETPRLQQCVYSPGEIYSSTNADLDVTTLESLAYANCFCIGQNMPGGHGRLSEQKTSRADHQVWYQYWNPRADKGYYLRDKWAECVQETTSTSSAHDTAQAACHDGGNYLPTEFSDAKHKFLLSLAQAGSMLTQWIGLQYDPVLRQWYWDYFDQIANKMSRIMASPNDYTNWNCNRQPDTSDSKYCVALTPGVSGCIGYKSTTTRCSGFQQTYHNQYLCQQDACDARKYCSDF